MEEIGYGREDIYDRLHEKILEEPTFRFNWFLKTRVPSELARRCQKLIGLLEKDEKENGKMAGRKVKSPKTVKLFQHSSF